MAQSQGYKRFILSLNTNHHGTSTPRTSRSKILPQLEIPVLSSKMYYPYIYINRLTLIEQQNSCHCKKRKS